MHRDQGEPNWDPARICQRESDLRQAANTRDRGERKRVPVHLGRLAEWRKARAGGQAEEVIVAEKRAQQAKKPERFAAVVGKRIQWELVDANE